ncbi:hypothetical protein [Shewanella woodyi]|uniref:Uncharacterized protein n=1 Tax=Shewanella woodyi (strain ATCC 51908 / MS32) TaxID=392500 RepID=B1KEZ2_SHEWM|nr:hypothetical protein [Shewanella woodyi]ACA85143.1 hypothetical protein Swoo_0848 [Shewanella woodyi ATCC 51908]
MFSPRSAALHGGKDGGRDYGFWFSPWPSVFSVVNGFYLGKCKRTGFALLGSRALRFELRKEQRKEQRQEQRQEHLLPLSAALHGGKDGGRDYGFQIYAD